MSENTPSMDHVRNMYARIMKPGGTVALWSRRQKEFDRWLTQHDADIREQIVRDIEQQSQQIESAQVRQLGYLPPLQSGIVAGYAQAARIARGEDQAHE